MTDRSASFTGSGMRLITDPHSMDSIPGQMTFEEETPRAYKATIEVTVVAPSLDEAQRLLFDAIADMSDRNALEARVSEAPSA